MDISLSKLNNKLPPLKNGFKGSYLELNKTPKLNNITIKDNNVYFLSNTGNRESLKFINKNNYTCDELFLLLQDLDKLWEKSIRNDNNFDYIT